MKEEKSDSSQKLRYMLQFSEAWPDKKIMQRTVAQTLYKCNITFLGKGYPEIAARQLKKQLAKH